MFSVRCSMFAFPLAASPSSNPKFKILNPPSHQPDATSTTFPIVGDSCSFSKQYWSSCSSAALAERPPPFLSMVPRSSTNGQGSYDPSNTLLFICHHVMNEDVRVLSQGGRHRPQRCRQTDPKGRGGGGACPGRPLGGGYEIGCLIEVSHFLRRFKWRVYWNYAT
jgi:hypothetical protein